MFVFICVGIVMFLIIAILSNLADFICEGYCWLVPSLGLAVCITILLYQNGII